MRVTTHKAIEAFLAGRSVKTGNTTVSPLGNTTVLKLHGNPIAVRQTLENGKESILISNAGWFSNTTKERLNGIPGVSIHQKNFDWFLNDEPWDGKWTEVAL